ncbi:MAG TPA: hypothetical protein DDY91_09065 [Planctomycetaceae bacterium]|nr:hypothetical protein [Planctomycetaceae bacterium]
MQHDPWQSCEAGNRPPRRQTDFDTTDYIGRRSNLRIQHGFWNSANRQRQQEDRPHLSPPGRVILTGRQWESGPSLENPLRPTESARNREQPEWKPAGR